MFFFEKKNQKTFINKKILRFKLRFESAKVFCFFFSKKKPFLR